MYHEDNPVTMQALKLKLGLSVGVHLLAIYYYFKGLPYGQIVYLGGFMLNIVRLTALLILHLAAYPNVAGAKAMLRFLVGHPNQFACGNILFPALICIFKVFLTLLAQFGSFYSLMFQTDELKTIKFATLLLVVATFDSKMTGIFYGINEDDMKA